MQRNRRGVFAWPIAVIFMLVSLGSAIAQPKPKGREVTGTIVDADQKPVAGATVSVSDGGPSATTGADGVFKLTGVATGNVVVEIKAEGFNARTIPLLAAATAVSLQVVLVKPQPPAATPMRTVAGVVTDGKRQPIAGARVTVHDTQLSATTGADGTFAINGVANAAVTLDIEAPGQPPVSLPVAADKTAVSVVVGQLEPGGEQPAAPTTRKVTGRVFDPSTNEPIVAAQVTVAAIGVVQFTEADGTFVIENAPVTPFGIEVSAGEHETRELQVPAERNTIDVALGLVQGEQIVIEGRAPAILKQNLANGASVISDQDLNRVSSATVDAAMQGKLAGANLQFNSGAPGGGAQLRLRGISTINGQSSPLYVIDG
ncbi:MAG TPA: carboxypeptidase regulatory-like domain-containing protein, partial [Kofleriaceae bacterium]